MSMGCREAEASGTEKIELGSLAAAVIAVREGLAPLSQDEYIAMAQVRRQSSRNHMESHQTGLHQVETHSFASGIRCFGDPVLTIECGSSP